MKIKVDNFIIEVKAKSIVHNRYNKKDTLYFLNSLSNWLYESAVYLELLGFDNMSKRNKEASHDIFMTLESEGIYNDTEE